MGMNTTTETERPAINYCGIGDKRLLAFLGEILVYNRFPEWADRLERELILGLLAHEHDGNDGRKYYQLTIRGHLVYDLLANNGQRLMDLNKRWS